MQDWCTYDLPVFSFMLKIDDQTLPSSQWCIIIILKLDNQFDWLKIKTHFDFTMREVKQKQF